MESTTRTNRRLVFLMVSFLAIIYEAASEKILILPASTGSHLMQVNSLSEGLIDRGHEVTTILNSKTKFARGILNPKLKVIEYDTGEEPIFQRREIQEALLANELTEVGTFDFTPFNKAMEGIQYECRGVLTSTTLFKRLEVKQFDFVIVDGLLKCLNLIPYKFGVSFGVFMAFLPPDIPHAGLQAPLLIRGPLDDLVSGENTPRVLATLGKIFIMSTFFNSLEVFGDIANITLYELQKQTKLWLYDVTKVLDTPIPVSPNVIHVGGLNVRKPKALPEGELKQFVDSASDGFILVSFGSFAKYFPDRIARILLDTFKDVPYKIVWKWDTKSLKPDQTLPYNVLAVNWMPQNDVLGHRNIKLFVTHCGNSGQHEALYNSVPMVGLPLFADQMFNCQKVEGRFGRHIRAKHLSKGKLLNLIIDVISDRKYSDNIKKASAIFRDQPMEPRETAAYWSEHVMKYGTDHLMSRTNEMSWIQILMWDVIFVIFVVAFVASTVVFLVCQCVYRRCSRRMQSKEKVKRS